MVKYVNIKNYISACNTNEDGNIIRKEIMKDTNKTVLSFSAINNVTPSFVNALFIELLNEKGLDYIKNNIIIKDSNSQINNMIKDRITYELNRKNI